MIKDKNEYLAAKRRTQIGNIIFNVVNAIVLTLLVVVTVYPFWNTIAISFNDGLDAVAGGIRLWPRKFTWQNYKALFTTNQIFTAFIISVTNNCQIPNCLHR